MTCIKNVNRLDRLMLGVRDPEAAERVAHEPACRLLVERLKWMTFAAVLIAILGAGLMWSFNREDGRRSRQQLADLIAKDCVDRPGDIAFRNVLNDLVALNEGRKPSDPKIARLPRTQQTAAVLRKGLEQAGPIPRCILDHVP